MPSGPVGFIHFEIVGNQRGVEQMLEHIDTALSPIGLFTFLHGAVGPFVKQRASDRFRSEGDDVTGTWAPLAQATVEIRQNMGLEGSHPINKRTGELEAYITQGSIDVTTGVGVGTLKYPGNAPATSGLREKLKTAQGGKASPSTPPRPVLGLGEADLGHVLVMLAFHVQKIGGI